MNVLIFIIIINYLFQINFAKDFNIKFQHKNFNSNKNDVQNTTNNNFKTLSKYPKTSVLADIFRKKIQNLKTHKEVELVILVDGSYSVGPKNFLSEMKYIQKVISDVEVGPKAFRLGVIIYSTQAVIHVDHLSVTDELDLEKCSLLHVQIPKIEYPGKNTNTKEALEKAEKILTRARKGAIKIIFLITDGFSNMGNPLPMAQILKDQDTIIYTFGIINGNARELLKIASQPIEEHAYLFTSFDEFEKFARRALHEDLSPGSYAPVKDLTMCNYLCTNHSDEGCCSDGAVCTCGLISGHFSCLCPPGYYGSGLRGEGCKLCPKGSYSQGLFPGDILSCTTCPDKYHTTINFPASDKSFCVCVNGTEPDGDKCKIVSCPTLSPPSNGYFVKKNCSNVINAACGVRCHMGYILTGTSVRICQKNGTWSGIDPVCKPKNCNPLKPVPSSQIICSNDDEEKKTIKMYDKTGNEIQSTLISSEKTKQIITAESDLSENINGQVEYSVGTKCSYSCLAGHSMIGSKTRDCLPMLKWSGLKPTCKKIQCLSLPQLPSGSIKPQNCTIKGIKHPFGKICKFYCNPGYELKGPKLTNCTGKHGTWSEKNTPNRCVDVEPPEIDCPKNHSTKTDDNMHFATLIMTLPNTTDNSGKKPVIWSKPIFEENSTLRFSIGDSEVQIYSVDESGNYGFCSFFVKVKDDEKPKILECQSPPTFFISELPLDFTEISWKEPVFDDNSGIPVTVTRTPHNFILKKGTTSINYTAIDISGNKEICSINVTILDNPCSEIPTDTNTLWNCSINDKKITTCKLSCPSGYGFSNNIADDIIDLNCTYFGRKAYWIPKLYVDDGFFPECTEMELPEIEIEVPDSFCDDLNMLSNDLNNETLSISTLCNEDYWNETSEEYDDDGDDDDFGFTSNENTFLDYDNDSLIFSKTEREKNINSILSNLFKVPVDKYEELQNLISSGNKTEKTKDEKNKLNAYTENNKSQQNLLYSSEGEFNEKKFTIVQESHNLKENDKDADDDDDDDNEKIREKRKVKKRRKKIKISLSLKDLKNKNKSDLISGNLSGTIGTIENLYSKLGKNSSGVIKPKIKTKIFCKNGSLPRNNFCVKCPKGTFHNVYNSKCDPCPIGHYQETEGQTSCKSCPRGFLTRRIRRKHVKQCLKICPPGSFGSISREANLSLSPCKMCPIGFYQIHEGQAHCESCPQNFTTLKKGSTNEKFCVKASELGDACTNINCRNGGHCFVIDGFPHCQCLPGFIGSFCERTFDPCGSDPCYNGGQCLLIDFINYKCQCSKGFEGEYCERNIDDCLSNPCNNHGECTDLINDFKCDCHSGFTGKTCNESLKLCQELQPCLNSGTCIDVNETYECICQKGFSGRHCDVIYDCDYENCNTDSEIPKIISDPCDNYTCLNNAKCVSDRFGQPQCTCISGFRGNNCHEEINPNVILNFPKYGVTEYLIADFPKNDLTEISVCVWIKTKDIFNYGTLFSYATSEDDNAFTLTDYSGVVLYVAGNYVVTDLQANDGFWHFICVTWQSFNGQWEVFLDGALFSNGTGLANNNTIKGGGKLVIGQEQDTVGGGFNDVESFAGQLTNFDVWKKLLTPAEIEILYGACDPAFGNFISWINLLQNVNGDITEEESIFCKTCDSNLKVHNGEISYDFSNHGKIANYNCNEGFIIKFDSDNNYNNKKFTFYQRKCMKYGGWQRKEPKCGRISCGFPGYFLRGKISGGSYLYGDEITYSCSPGYTLEGDNIRICLSNGTWSGKPPTCSGYSTECEKLMAPRYGSMFVYFNNTKPYSSSTVAIGDRVEFTCDEGYALKGFPVLTCIEGGVWDREPATCEKISCRIPIEILDVLPPALDSNSKFYFGNIITITCPSGSKKNISCGHLGNWNYTDNICKNLCKEKPPRSIKNGYFVEENPKTFYNEGEIFEIKCKVGFYLRGDNYFKCSENGTWIQNQKTVCHPINCGPPPRPPPAYQIIHEEGYKFKNKIFLQCSKGYISTGKIFIRCEANGRYSRVTNYCNKISCGAPILPDNYYMASHNSDYTYGSKIVVYCSRKIFSNQNFKNFIECQADGKWSFVPKCE